MKKISELTCTIRQTVQHKTMTDIECVIVNRTSVVCETNASSSHRSFGGWGDGSLSKNACCFSRGPTVISQRPHGDSEIPVTPLGEDPLTSSDLYRPRNIWDAQTDMQAKHLYMFQKPNKTNKNL